MAFWRKTIELPDAIYIELPDAIYEEAGGCTLTFVEVYTMAQELGVRDTHDGTRVFKKSSGMTFDQAFELLDLTQNGFNQLHDLLAQCPIKSGSQFEIRDHGCKASIQSCEKYKKAILALSEDDRSMPIGEYIGHVGGENADQFEHLIFCCVEWLGVENTMVFKLMAKSANMSSKNFFDRATATVMDELKDYFKSVPSSVAASLRC